MKISFNKAYANKVSKAIFIKQHEHFGDDADLGEAWESLQEKSDKKQRPPADEEKQK